MGSIDSFETSAFRLAIGVETIYSRQILRLNEGLSQIEIDWQIIFQTNECLR
jgi:hypothetical protein